MSFQDHKHEVDDKRAVILLSGGLDSAVLAAMAKRFGWSLFALSFDYGQRHHHELNCVQQLVDSLKIKEWRMIRVDLSLLLRSPLLSEKPMLPLRTLEEIREDKGASPAVVPGRNLIFLSLAGAFAQSRGIQKLMIGATIEDQAGFYDCRPEFFEAAGKAMGIEVLAPLINLRKLELVEMGLRWPELDFAQTSSCYQPSASGRACGRCDPCVIRLDAFEKLGAEDPAPYAWRP